MLFIHWFHFKIFFVIFHFKKGFFPYTPATNLLYGLDEAINMLLEEGLENVCARHQRHADATRLAVKAWGLEILCKNPDEYSNSLTAVLVPDGHDADALRKVILDNYNMSLGMGLNKIKGKMGTFSFKDRKVIQELEIYKVENNKFTKF